MWLRKDELDSLLTEYREICADLREKHRTIWYVRSFYMGSLAAFLTYGASIKVRPLVVGGFFVAMSLLMISFDVKYQRVKQALEDYAQEIANKMGMMSHFDKIKEKRKISYWFQVAIIYSIFLMSMMLWFYTLTIL